MGAGDFIHNPQTFETPHTKSVYVPDYVINPHPRFAALTRNIRSRRGKKVDIQVPLFKDSRTPEFVSSGISEQTHNTGFEVEVDTNIHMDCMAFGMGMCCLVSYHVLFSRIGFL
jgi:glutamate--cysteine ligase catalytic subunit